MLKLAQKGPNVCKGFDQGPGAIGRSLRSACLYTYIRISQLVRNTMSVIETVFAVWKYSKPWLLSNINATYTLRLWEWLFQVSAMWMWSFGLPNKKRCGSHKSLLFSLISLFVRVGKFAVSCIMLLNHLTEYSRRFSAFYFCFASVISTWQPCESEATPPTTKTMCGNRRSRNKIDDLW
jgi:hypothetical protein